MPKAVRLFLADHIKFNVSINIPTKIDTRVIRVQKSHINVIDLSERYDIESVEMNVKLKEGTKPLEKKDDFVTKSLPLNTMHEETPEFVEEKRGMSGLSKYISNIFGRCR